MSVQSVNDPPNCYKDGMMDGWLEFDGGKCCECRKNGVEAAYRNDQRQEYVNNLAYKHRTGLGTAPWYGVPGTAYDFGSSKSVGGATYHHQTDASHPSGYGYSAPLAQYHSQPSSYHASHGGYKMRSAARCAPAVVHGKEMKSDDDKVNNEHKRLTSAPAETDYSSYETLGYQYHLY